MSDRFAPIWGIIVALGLSILLWGLIAWTLRAML